MTLSIAELDAMPDARLADALGACCGAPAWISAMLAQRPFCTREALLRAADEEWSKLGPADWLAAFAHHPRLGERKAAADVSRSASAWSEGEQAGTRTAPAQIVAQLAEANRAYEARFGFIFILCATGLSATEMLAALERRLRNDLEVEQRIAAEEQRKITKLRLEKLVPVIAPEPEVTR
jgi:2-oxo-4-hydroxy-4-carboxy-5-ureidoimidazoline decarboxylase